ncbi:MAG: hypothetical protein AAB373_02200 [Patescibacteria group bacterium]
MNQLSIRVSENNQRFLEQMAERGKSKTAVVNDALDFLRKAQLQSELTAMATDNPEEDVLMAAA